MRKYIVIEVVTSETYGKVWEQVDTYQDQQMTIQHISNLLTGVDSITASSTDSIFFMIGSSSIIVRECYRFHDLEHTKSCSLCRLPFCFPLFV